MTLSDWLNANMFFLFLLQSKLSASLETLDLNDNHITQGGMPSLARLLQVRLLHFDFQRVCAHIHYHSCIITFFPAQTSSNLTRLSLGGNPILPAGIATLCNALKVQ